MIGRSWRLGAAIGASIVGISLFGSPAYAYETVSGGPITCDPGLQVTITTIVSTGTTTHRWTYAGVPLAASWGIGAYHKTDTRRPALDSWSAETEGTFVSAVAACEPPR
ncbi:MAG: hypothetical protein ABW000_03360 [Actinoplanes sp.]